MPEAALDVAPEQAPEKPRSRPNWAAIGAVVAGTVAITLHASRFGKWIVDDAAITFAYARSIAEGHGPVLQPGAEPVEAFSNPSWLVLLSVGRLVGLFDHGSIFGIPDYVVYPKALAVLCCAGILVAFYRTAAALTRRPALVTLCAGIALAAIPSFVIWCFSGLENSLFALAVSWLAAVVCRGAVNDRLLTPRVAITAGLLAALAALTRPDGAIYVTAFPVLALLRVTKPTWRPVVQFALLSVVAYAVPYGAYIGWRVLEFGQLLSMPAVAKGQQPPDTSTLGRVSEVVTYGGALAALLLAICVGIALVQPSRLRVGLAALLVPLTLALVAYTILMPDWMAQQRFATPIWPLICLVGTLAIGRAIVRSNIRGRVVIVLGTVVALVPSVSTFADASDSFRASPTVPMCVVLERFGLPFNHYADLLGVRQGSVLMPDIGGTALVSRLQIIDLAGLAEKRIAQIRGGGTLVQQLPDYVFETARPTFIHMHQAWGASLYEDPRLARDYEVIYTAGKAYDGTDLVRRDAVPNPGALTAARAYASQAIATANAQAVQAPLRACGATLRP
ncbi:hypothetical protein [Actinocrispum wychmicini]|uniref:Dolichyl-phosphate-mannose-protein mannosyltransferase n=1 Tax=Actinocrispum wychmicini TaxID=1213861 RepID=A0A4R2IQY5_9PSEU|nr:hypothetical protein [Actinocrispum wychmicini]TCO47357.1 hypothetical protein EV192_11797 [Actinocrispum wychmicini]